MAKKNKELIGLDCRELTRENVRSVGLILAGFVRYLSQRGYDLVLFSDVDLKEEYIPAGAKTVSRGLACGKGFDVVRYQLWVKNNAVRIGISHFYQVNHYALFKIRGCRISTTIHDLYPLAGIEHFSAPYTAYYKMFIRRTLKNSDAITTPSEATLADLENRFGSIASSEVIYWGVDNIPSRGLRAPTQQIDGPFLLFLGRIGYWKGTLRLLEIYDSYLSDSGYKLVVAGEAFDAETVAKLEDFKLRNKQIVHLGYVDEDEREWLYRNAALLCYPSRFDGFGLPPLEAAKRSTKCLMNDIPVLREVTNGLGYYVDYYGEDERVVNAILEALEDGDDRSVKLKQLADSLTWESSYKKLAAALLGDRGEFN